MIYKMLGNFLLEGLTQLGGTPFLLLTLPFILLGMWMWYLELRQSSWNHGQLLRWKPLGGLLDWSGWKTLGPWIHWSCCISPVSLWTFMSKKRNTSCLLLIVTNWNRLENLLLITICKLDVQCKFSAWNRALKASWDNAEGWGGEGGEWRIQDGGTSVHPWLIHVDIRWKPPQYCKVISLQLK